MTIWNLADQPLAACPSTIPTSHVCGNAGFVNENKPFRIKSGLSCSPSPTRRGDVWPVLFCRAQAFF